jgi:hypothetical protein
MAGICGGLGGKKIKNRHPRARFRQATPRHAPALLSPRRGAVSSKWNDGTFEKVFIVHLLVTVRNIPNPDKPEPYRFQKVDSKFYLCKRLHVIGLQRCRKISCAFCAKLNIGNCLISVEKTFSGVGYALKEGKQFSFAIIFICLHALFSYFSMSQSLAGAARDGTSATPVDLMMFSLSTPI